MNRKPVPHSGRFHTGMKNAMADSFSGSVCVVNNVVRKIEKPLHLQKISSFKKQIEKSDIGRGRFRILVIFGEELVIVVCKYQ